MRAANEAVLSFVVEEGGDVGVDGGVDDLPAALGEIGVEPPADGAFAEIDGVDDFADGASGGIDGEEFGAVEFAAGFEDFVGDVGELLEEFLVFLADEGAFEVFLIGCGGAFFAEEGEKGFDAGLEGGVEVLGRGGG